MSISLTQVQQTEFDMAVKAAYKSKGGLFTKAVYMKQDVIGRFVDFRKVNSLIAVPQAFQDEVTPQDPNYGKATATLQKYVAPAMVDEIQQLTVNFSERVELAQLSAEAILRRSDQILIDALNTSGTSNTIAADFGSSSGNTNLTAAKMQEVVRIFDNLAVPQADRFIAIGASQSSDLLGIQQFTDSRFTNIAPGFITGGSIDGSRNYGLNFIVVPFMDEGGLPVTGTVRKCFAFHRRSLGMGVGENLRTEINYIPQQTSWLINSIFFAGAIAIDPNGMIDIACDEAA